jgi:hypothetical protein
MEADRVGSRLADPAPPPGDQPILASHFLAVVAEAEASLMNQSEALHIAIVAGFDP